FKETTFTVSTLPRAWLEPPRSLCSLRGLKAHGTALSFVPPKTFCYSRWSRCLPFQSTRLALNTLWHLDVLSYEIDTFNMPPSDLVKLKVTDSTHFMEWVVCLCLFQDVTELCCTTKKTEITSQQLEYARLLREERP